MTRADIDEKLRGIFSMVLDISHENIDAAITPDTCENWDSLAQVTIIAAIEDAFSVIISPDEQFELISFDLAGDILAKKSLS